VSINADIGSLEVRL